MSQEALKEIEVLIRARYPIIYVISWEEQRVEEFLLALSQRRGKKLFQWSYTTGIVPAGVPLQSQRYMNAATKDPLVALQEVIEQVEPSVYLFKDFHPFLGKNNFAIIRRLKEVALHLKDSYKTLVLVSSVLCIPPELEKEITVLDYPLPTVQDFSALLDKISSDVADNPNIEIKLPEDGRESLLQAALGLTMTETENVFAKILVHNQGKLGPEDARMVSDEKKQIIRKTGLLEYCETQVGLGEVGGVENLKEWLRKRKKAFSSRARRFGLPVPKGVLLLGVQGCGKSLCAKAVSQLWKLPLLRFDVGKVFGSLVGSSEENMRRAIVVAESVSPCVLWVDEIDKAFAGGTSSSTDSGTTARVIGTFLTWMAEKTRPVFIIATANNISALPPELLRKGRLDEIFYVDLPSPEERREIFRIHLEKRKRDPQKFDLETLSKNALDFSGAEIEEAIISALYEAYDLERDVTTQDILEALAATVPLSKTMEEQLSRFRNWAQGRARLASGKKEEPPQTTDYSKIEL